MDNEESYNIPDSDLRCATPNPAYTSAYEREKEEHDERVMVLTPWTVQNICYEVLKNYMVLNSPQKEGYRFSQSYDPDDLKTGIALEIAFNYKDAVVQKRPGLYVSRGEASFTFPTINQTIGLNSIDSEKTRYSMVQMPIAVAVVATNVGFAEQLAEYVFKIFLRYQEVIKDDFCLRQFKLVSLSEPALYLESKDHFVVNVNILAVFDMGATIRGDHLKLKKVAYTIFTSCLEKPLLGQ
jgi:hypothetical protein